MSDDLGLGLQEHQRGRLREAARLYRNLLGTQPEHPDAALITDPANRDFEAVKY